MKSTQTQQPAYVRLDELPEVIAAARVVDELHQSVATTSEAVQRLEAEFNSRGSTPNKNTGHQAVQRALAAASGNQLADDDAQLGQRLAAERKRLDVLRDGLHVASHEYRSIVEEASRRHMATRAPQLREALLVSIEGYERVKASVPMYRATKAEAASLGYWSDSGGNCAWDIYTAFEEEVDYKLRALREALYTCERVMEGATPDQIMPRAQMASHAAPATKASSQGAFFADGIPEVTVASRESAASFRHAN